MTIASGGDTLAPADRVLTIYQPIDVLLPSAHVG
jgi:hypothetical protein